MSRLLDYIQRDWDDYTDKGGWWNTTQSRGKDEGDGKRCLQFAEWTLKDFARLSCADTREEGMDRLFGSM